MFKNNKNISKRRVGIYVHAIFNFVEAALSGSLKWDGLPETAYMRSTHALSIWATLLKVHRYKHPICTF